MSDSRYWVDRLNLEKHPAGSGYYKAIYRSTEEIKQNHLPARFDGDRLFCSSIFYLLENGDIPLLHRVKSDEQLFHVEGGSMEVHVFNENDKNYSHQTLGKEEGNSLHIIIPQCAWFSYTVCENSKYALLNCTLSPAFDPVDFEIANKEDKQRLINLFPNQKSILEKFIY